MKRTISVLHDLDLFRRRPIDVVHPRFAGVAEVEVEFEPRPNENEGDPTPYLEAAFRVTNTVDASWEHEATVRANPRWPAGVRKVTVIGHGHRSTSVGDHMVIEETREEFEVGPTGFEPVEKGAPR